jgi:hypothetical protein
MNFISHNGSLNYSPDMVNAVGNNAPLRKISPTGYAATREIDEKSYKRVYTTEYKQK